MFVCVIDAEHIFIRDDIMYIYHLDVTPKELRGHLLTQELPQKS